MHSPKQQSSNSNLQLDSNSNLLERLNAFLPAIATANKELDSLKKSEREIIKIDELSELYKCSEEKDCENVVNSKNKKRGSKSIEMDVAIGDMNSTPLFHTLLNDKNEVQKDAGINVVTENVVDTHKSQQVDDSNLRGITTNEKSIESEPGCLETQLEIANDCNFAGFMTEISTKRRKIEKSV